MHVARYLSLVHNHLICHAIRTHMNPTISLDRTTLDRKSHWFRVNVTSFHQGLLVVEGKRERELKR